MPNRFPILVALAFAMSASAQTCDFSQQKAVDTLYLWEVACSGFHADIAEATLWAASIGAHIGHVNNQNVSDILTSVEGKRLYSKALLAVSICSGGAAVGAVADAQTAGWAQSKLAKNIAAGGGGLTLLAGVVLPAMQAHKPAAPTVPPLIGAVLPVGSTGSASGLFFSLQGGAPFSVKIQ
jgi:hypothetical protein